jgi:hypothetical protein
MSELDMFKFSTSCCELKNDEIEETNDEKNNENQESLKTDNENISFGMKQEKDSNTGEITAELTESKDYLKRSRGRPWTLPQPIKFYRFPDSQL